MTDQDEEKQKQRKVAVELKTAESGASYSSDMSKIPIILMADRMILEFIPPPVKLEGTNLDLYRPVGYDQNSVKGKIVSIGDSSDKDRPIPLGLRHLGLIVKYSKNYAETFEWVDPEDGQKKTYHMIRWNEIQYIM